MRIIVVAIFFLAVTHLQAQKYREDQVQRWYSEGRYAEVVALTASWVRQHPADFDAWMLLGNAYQRLEQPNQAILAYTSVIDRSLHPKEALFQRALLYRETGLPELAVEDWAHYLEIPVRETTQVFFHVSPGAEGASGVSSVSQMDGEAYNHLGLCYLDLKAYDKARLAFLKALELDSSRVQVWINLSMVAEKNRDRTEARKYIHRALEINPSHPLARLRWQQLQDQNEAGVRRLDVLNEIVEAYPKLASAYHERAQYYYQQNAFSNALSDMDRALQLEPENDALHAFRGRVLAAAQRYDLSLKAYDRAIHLNEAEARYYFERGNVHFYIDDWEAAAADYSLTLYYDAVFADAYVNRAVVYQRMGEDRKACIDAQKAQVLHHPQAEEMVRTLCKESAERK